MELDALYDEVREVCDRKAWARGLELARRKAVRKVTDKKYVLVDPLKASDHEIEIDPVEIDWSCTCAGKWDPCEHTCAVLAALKVAADGGPQILKYETNSYVLDYELVESRVGYLTLKRSLHKSNAEKGDQDSVLPVKHSVLSMVSGRIEGPPVSAKSYDLEIDRVLVGDYGARLDGFISGPRAWKMLLPHLEKVSRSQQLVVDGKPILVNSSEKAFNILEIQPQDKGVLLKLSPNPSIVKQFKSGVCIYEGSSGLELRFVAPADLPASIMSELQRGRFFNDSDKVELFSKLLPQLKERFKIVEKGIDTNAVYAQLGFCVRNQILGPQHLETSFHISYGDPVIAYLDGGRLVCLGDQVPHRNLEREVEKRRDFEREHFLELSKVYRYSEEELFEWVSRISRLPFNFIGDSLDTLNVIGKSKVLTKLLDDDVEFSFEIDEQAVAVDPQALIESYEKGSKFVKTEKGYVEIKPDWLDEYHDLIRSLVVRKKVPKAEGIEVLESIRIIEGFGYAPPKKLKAEKEKLFSKVDDRALDTVQAELRPYQVEGVKWLVQLKNAKLGALLADDMGLGKTLQSLAVVSSRTLIICPTSLIFNWKNEIQNFRPDLSFSIYHGSTRELDLSADVVITTYGILRTDVDRLNNENWRCVIIDEAQVIKNPQSKAAQALWQLKSDFKLALTGTPIENHYKDLWSIFRFIAPGLLGELSYFNQHIVRPIQGQSLSALKSLRSRINPFVLRRSKKQVLSELPDKTELVNYCQLTEEQKHAYDNYLGDVKTKIVENDVKPIQIFELILRLRQFACDPRLVNSDFKGGSGKLDLFKELIGEVTEENHKSLVFSQWTSFLDLIEVELDHLGIPYFRLDGSTKNREKVVSDYNECPSACVFLLSLKAGGVGLNLTSADHVFLMDPWWNPATERQAIDRAHRIGQKNPVMIHRLVGKDTIEEKVVKLQKIKEQMSDSVLENMESANLSKDDLLSLLE